jgi:hypothetical protein
MTERIDLDSYIHPEVTLSGQAGNAFVIIAKVSKALRRIPNIGYDIAAQYRTEAKNGDYDHVIQTSMDYADVT